MSRVAGCCCGVVAALIVMGGGCGKSAVRIPNVAEAAAQLEKAFVNAPVEVKQAALATAEGLRTAEYDKVMHSLKGLMACKELTADQRMAVHEAEVAMVAAKMATSRPGDASGKRAYEQNRKGK